MIKLIGIFDTEFTGKVLSSNGYQFCSGDSLDNIVRDIVQDKLSYRRSACPNSGRLDGLSIEFEYNEEVAKLADKEVLGLDSE